MQFQVEKYQSKKCCAKEVLHGCHTILAILSLYVLLFALYPSNSIKSLCVFSTCLFHSLQIMFKLAIWKSKGYDTVEITFQTKPCCSQKEKYCLCEFECVTFTSVSLCFLWILSPCSCEREVKSQLSPDVHYSMA